MFVDLDIPYDLDNKQKAVLVMRDIDRLPRRWRELVYEYGWSLVCAARESGMSFDEAFAYVVSMHERRQNEWLSTNFIPKGTRLFRKVA